MGDDVIRLKDFRVCAQPPGRRTTIMGKRQYGNAACWGSCKKTFHTWWPGLQSLPLKRDREMREALDSTYILIQLPLPTGRRQG